MGWESLGYVGASISELASWCSEPALCPGRYGSFGWAKRGSSLGSVEGLREVESRMGPCWDNQRASSLRQLECPREEFLEDILRTV